MSEDAKKILNSKAMSDNELDNVAGGTTAQNMAILNGIAQFDSAGVSDVLEKAGKASGAGKPGLAEMYIGEGVMKLIRKHFGKDGVSTMPIRDLNNVYSQNGKTISHDDVMKMINKRAEEAGGFEIV